MSSAVPVQKIYIDSTLFANFWPTVSTNTRTWDPDALGEGNQTKYLIRYRQNMTIDIINDIGWFALGDNLTIGCHVQSSSARLHCPTTFVLAQNGRTAVLKASGDLGTTAKIVFAGEQSIQE